MCVSLCLYMYLEYFLYARMYNVCIYARLCGDDKFYSHELMYVCMHAYKHFVIINIMQVANLINHLQLFGFYSRGNYLRLRMSLISL